MNETHFPSMRTNKSKTLALFAACAALLPLSGCRLPADWAAGRGFLAGNPPGTTVRRAIIPQQTTATAFRVSSLNDTARYLAGMPGSVSSPLAGDRNSSHWQTYQANLNELWRQFSAYREPKIETFSRSELGSLRGHPTVFYPFSGPDILFAQAFFPDARTYILCGLEGEEMLPDLGAMDAADRQAGLDGIYTSLTTALNCSFFITKDMRVDLQRTRLRGTLPVVLVFLARLGMDIESVQPVHLAPGGALAAGPGDGRCPGYHVQCGSPWRGQRDIYYFRENLADGELSHDQRFLQFSAQFGSPVTYLKSASYLMHSNEFSTIRSHILNRSVALLQDDSGIPVRYLREPSWQLNLYGNYIGVLDIFLEYYQPELTERYNSIPAADRHLDFGLGYHHEAGKSALMLARRRS